MPLRQRRARTSPTFTRARVRSAQRAQMHRAARRRRASTTARPQRAALRLRSAAGVRRKASRARRSTLSSRTRLCLRMTVHARHYRRKGRAGASSPGRRHVLRRRQRRRANPPRASTRRPFRACRPQHSTLARAARSSRRSRRRRRQNAPRRPGLCSSATSCARRCQPSRRARFAPQIIRGGRAQVAACRQKQHLARGPGPAYGTDRRARARQSTRLTFAA